MSGNMNSEHRSSKNVDEDLRRMAGLVANIPDADPPDTIIDSVMARIQPRRLSLPMRLWHGLRTPITLTPLKIAPLGAAIAAAILVLAVFLGRAPDRHDVASRLEGMKAPGRIVVFTLDNPDASSVDVIGSFNRWTPGDLKMRWDRGRRLWVFSLQLESGMYEYAFLIDGRQVVADPKAMLQEEDGFGNRNSVLIIERDNGHETGI